MTWWMIALLSLLYSFIGGIVGYLVFDDDSDGMMLGLFWPILLAGFFVYTVCLIPFKAAVFTVNGIKKLIDILSKIKWGHHKEEDRSWAAEPEELDTTCDKCERLDTCIEEGRLLESTTINDTRKHYIVGRGCTCANVEYLDKNFSDWRNRV